jgi:hypothetical protein
LKDFYDMWRLASITTFQGPGLVQAVDATFRRRKTEIPVDVPAALREALSTNPARVAQWNRMVARFAPDEPSPSLPEACAAIESFVMPIFASIRDGRIALLDWPPDGPWEIDTDSG